jgi:hypothetical protein
MIYSPFLGFRQAKQLHAYQLRPVCLVLLHRNVVDCNSPDLLKRI